MAITPTQYQAFETFLKAPRGDKLICFNIGRNTLIAFVFSLLIHAVILFFVVPKIQLEKIKEPTTFVVELAQPEQAKIITEPLPPAPILEPFPEEKTIEKPKVITQKPSKNAKPPVFTVPKLLATKKSTPATLQQSAEKPKEIDMLAYVNVQRAKRNQAESAAAKINAEAAKREIAPSEEEKRDAKIKNNFQNGTNGVFEITRLESQSAGFTFLGWTSHLSNARREFFEVEAPPGQDVRLLMIRRMIALIRVHYQGDFDWESHRLGRTIVQSARVEDSAELEEFLMMEFFGANYKTAL